jgi:hypothetical protein
MRGAIGPDGGGRELRRVAIRQSQAGQAAQPEQAVLPHLVMPAHHEVRPSDVFERRLHATLAAAADRGPADFPELLLIPGVGPRTVQALAMVAEVVHGAPYRFADPARFSLAHGGKDGHPFPVPLRVYDETIRVLKSAVQRAKLGRGEERGALQRLDDQARRLQHHPWVPGLTTRSRRRQRSPMYGGRSVFGWEHGWAKTAPSTRAINGRHCRRRVPRRAVDPASYRDAFGCVGSSQISYAERASVPSSGMGLFWGMAL